MRTHNTTLWIPLGVVDKVMPELNDSNNDSTSTNQNRVSTANSASRSRRTVMGPYHNIASTLFSQNSADLVELFLAAARDGDYERLQNFLQRRGDILVSVDVKDRRTGNTPIIWAAKRGHAKIVQLLLRHGADVTLRNYDNQTAVEVASPAIKQILLDSVERTGSAHQHLLQAAWQGNITQLRKILSENRTVDIDCRNNDGQTPLLLVTRDVYLFEKLGAQLVSSYNPLEVVSELINHRADINACDPEDKTSLHFASSSKSSIAAEISDLMLNEGANVDAKDKRCMTPIHCASQCGNIDVVLALLQHGSDPNARGLTGATPLHITAYSGHEKVASALLTNGADVTLIDDTGRTALDIAVSKKVKATLKQAWVEATQKKKESESSLAPVRNPSREGPRTTNGKAVKKKGQVIFDSLMTGHNGKKLSPLQLKDVQTILNNEDRVRPDWESQAFLQSMNKDGPRKLGQPRRVSKLGQLPKMSTSPEKEKCHRQLTPIDRTRSTSLQYSRSASDLGVEVDNAQKAINKRYDQTRTFAATPNADGNLQVTVLGLELDDSNLRVDKSAAWRRHSDPHTTSILDLTNTCDELMMRGRSSSLVSGSTEEDDDSSPPPRVTPTRTPSGSDRRRMKIPDTIQEGEVSQKRPVILDLDQMRLTQNSGSPLFIDYNTMYPNRRVLPPTPGSSHGRVSSTRLIDISSDFGSPENSPDDSSKEETPRSVSHSPDDDTSANVLMRNETVFNIEDSRVTQKAKVKKSTESTTADLPTPSLAAILDPGVLQKTNVLPPVETKNDKRKSLEKNSKTKSVTSKDKSPTMKLSPKSSTKDAVLENYENAKKITSSVQGGRKEPGGKSIEQNSANQTARLKAASKQNASKLMDANSQKQSEKLRKPTSVVTNKIMVHSSSINEHSKDKISQDSENMSQLHSMFEKEQTMKDVTTQQTSAGNSVQKTFVTETADIAEFKKPVIILSTEVKEDLLTTTDQKSRSPESSKKIQTDVKLISPETTTKATNSKKTENEQVISRSVKTESGMPSKKYKKNENSPETLNKSKRAKQTAGAPPKSPKSENDKHVLKRQLSSTSVANVLSGSYPVKSQTEKNTSLTKINTNILSNHEGKSPRIVEVTARKTPRGGGALKLGMVTATDVSKSSHLAKSPRPVGNKSVKSSGDKVMNNESLLISLEKLNELNNAAEKGLKKIRRESGSNNISGGNRTSVSEISKELERMTNVKMNAKSRGGRTDILLHAIDVLERVTKEMDEGDKKKAQVKDCSQSSETADISEGKLFDKRASVAIKPEGEHSKVQRQESDPIKKTECKNGSKPRAKSVSNVGMTKSSTNSSLEPKPSNISPRKSVSSGKTSNIKTESGYVTQSESGKSPKTSRDGQITVINNLENIQELSPLESNKAPPIEFSKDDGALSKAVTINFLEHTGPVIKDAFENFPQPVELKSPISNKGDTNSKLKTGYSRQPTVFNFAVGKGKDISTKSKNKSASKKGSKDTKEKESVSHVNSGGKQRRGSNKSKETPKDEESKSRRPSNDKKRVRRKKKKGDGQIHLSNTAYLPDTALISGIGWHIETKCNENSDVAMVTMKDSSSDEEVDYSPNLFENIATECDDIAKANNTLKINDVIPKADDVITRLDLSSINNAANQTDHNDKSSRSQKGEKRVIPKERKAAIKAILEKHHGMNSEQTEALIPQTLRAIKDFSKEIQDDDLNRILGLDGTDSFPSLHTDSYRSTISWGDLESLDSIKQQILSDLRQREGHSRNVSTVESDDDIFPESEHESVFSASFASDTPSCQSSANSKSGSGKNKLSQQLRDLRLSGAKVREVQEENCDASRNSPVTFGDGKDTNKIVTPSDSVRKTPEGSQRINFDENMSSDDLAKIENDVDKVLNEYMAPNTPRFSESMHSLCRSLSDSWNSEVNSWKEKTFVELKNSPPSAAASGDKSGVPNSSESKKSNESKRSSDNIVGNVKNDEHSSQKMFPKPEDNNDRTVTPNQSHSEPKKSKRQHRKHGLPPRPKSASRPMSAGMKHHKGSFTEVTGQPAQLSRPDVEEAAKHSSLKEVDELSESSAANSDMLSDWLSIAEEGDEEVFTKNAAQVLVINSPDARTYTSRLGRRSTQSRAGSSCTQESDMEEVIQWKKGNLLGKGAYGRVWCGLTNAGELIAVKQIDLNIHDWEKAEREYEKIQEEVDLLKTLKHKNIVGFLGTSLDDSVVSIFMQFVPGGSIANLLARFGALEEGVFCRYTKQVLEGVTYLHSNNVIHRDIKGGNIMLMPNGVIKLIDFGCAKRMCLQLSVSRSEVLRSMRGTPYWMAPEVILETGHGKKSDIWSVGCTIFEMATRKPPWSEMAPMVAIFAIGSDSKPIPQLAEKFSKEARHFVNLCLTRNQNKRPSASELAEHPFITKRKLSSG